MYSVLGGVLRKHFFWGSTQPLTEISTRNISLGVGGGEEIANPKAPNDYSSTPVFAPDKHFATPYYGCRIDESSLFILKLFTLRVLYK